MNSPAVLVGITDPTGFGRVAVLIGRDFIGA